MQSEMHLLRLYLLGQKYSCDLLPVFLLEYVKYCIIFWSSFFPFVSSLSCSNFSVSFHEYCMQLKLHFFPSFLPFIFHFFPSQTVKQRCCCIGFLTVSLVLTVPTLLSSLNHKLKMQYLHFRSHAKYFLLLWKIPEVMTLTVTFLSRPRCN